MASSVSSRVLRLGHAVRISQRSPGLYRQFSRPDWHVPRSLPATGVLQTRSFSWNPLAASSPQPVNAPPPEPLSDSFAPEIVNDGLGPDKSLAVDSSVSSSSATVDTLAPLPSTLSDLGTTLSDAASSVAVSAYQAGDMAAAGLTSWWPSGIMNTVIEQVHLYTGGPWVNTLVITTIAMRTLLLQPQIRAARAAARLMPYQGRLEKVQAETVAAAQSGDIAERQRIALERQAIHQEAGVKTTDMMMAPLVMLPTQIGMFLGVKYMCDLPLPQLAAESWQWIPSLAVADPTYMLPLINMVLVQGTLWLAQKDSATEKAGHTLNAFRVIALTGLPVMSTLPAAVNIVVLTQSLFGIVQSTALRTNVVRHALGMPLVDPMMKPPTIMDSFVKFKQVIEKAKEDAQNQASQGR